jgi:hypothetical protein
MYEGYPVDDASHVALKTVRDFLNKNKDEVKKEFIHYFLLTQYIKYIILGGQSNIHSLFR